MTFTLEQWIALLPILITGLAAVAVMMGIAAYRHHWTNATISVIGLNLALLACARLLFGPDLYPESISAVLPQQITPLLIVDNFAVFYMGLILSATLATATLSHAYLEGYKGHPEEYYVLLVLAALGGLVLACSNHMASLFIGVELLSLPLFGMIAYPARDKLALEGGIKYLILSAAASAFMLFGIVLIYAQTGALSFSGIAAALANGGGSYALLGTTLLLAGIAFKLSLVPFHLWTPDVYQGAPAPVAAFLSTASKTAIFAVALRYFVEAQAYQFPSVMDALSVLAILSIIVGNVLALMQNNLKRLLAYSSIAHFGYLLVALIATGPLAVEAVGVYLLTYVITNLGAFGVVTLMSSPMGERDADEISDYRGLFWRRPFLTAILTAMLISLAGIPLTAGFIGKFYVIATGLDQKLWLLLGAVVLGSAIGLYYYLRILTHMFQPDPERMRFDAPLNWGSQAGGLMVLGLMLLMLVMGIYPEPFIAIITQSGLPAR